MARAICTVPAVRCVTTSSDTRAPYSVELHVIAMERGTKGGGGHEERNMKFMTKFLLKTRKNNCYQKFDASIHVNMSV